MSEITVSPLAYDLLQSRASCAETTRISRSRWLWTFGVLGTVSLAPLLLTILPPLADFPNNLARMYVLANLHSNPDLQRFYKDITAAQPNMAMEMVVLPLQRIVGLAAASKMFVGSSMLALVVGTALLHRALHRRLSFWPLLSFLFVYNRLFLWGFASYMFSLGVALAGAALWVATRERPWGLRIVANTVAITLAYLTHLYGFGVYVLIVTGYEVSRYFMNRDFRALIRNALMGVVSALPAVLLFLLVSPTSNAAHDIAWGSWHRKMEAPVNLFYTYDWRFDVACFAIVGVGFVIWLLIGKILINRAMIGSLVLLFVVALVMPDKLFSSYFADQRLPIAFALCAIAATDGEQMSGWRQAWPVTIALAIYALRVAFIGLTWMKADAVYRADIDVIEHLPYGAKVLPVVANAADSLPHIPEYEIASLAVIKRQAFVPSLFAYPRNAGQTIAFTGEFQALVDRTPDAITYRDRLKKLKNVEFARTDGPFRPDLLAAYDFALVVHLEDIPAAAQLPANLPIVASSPTLTLVQLHPMPSSSQ